MARLKHIRRREAAEAAARSRKQRREERRRLQAELEGLRTRRRAARFSQELIAARRMPPGLRPPQVRELYALLQGRPVPGRSLDLVRFVEERAPRTAREKLVALHRLARVLPLHLAEGGSLRQAAPLIPVQLTRRMLSLFVQQGRRELGLLGSARRAQVLALGGSSGLAAALHGTMLGRVVLPDEAFVPSLIAWLVQVRAPLGRVGPVVDYLLERQRREQGFRVTGRSLAAVELGVAAWHAELRHVETRDKAPQQEFFELVGVSDFELGGRGPRWTVRQLGSRTELFYEGQAMRHCVYSYDHRVRAGSCSIWSLRVDGRRRATIELHNSSGMLVQVRGPSNASISPREFQVLELWAAEEGLTIPEVLRPR